MGCVNTVQKKRDFLDSLRADVQNKEKDSDKLKNQKTEYLNDIDIAQDKLNKISIEFKKDNKNEDLLNNLINQFNKELEELKKKYRLLMLSSEEDDSEQREMFQVIPLNPPVSDINSLNPRASRKFLKKSEYFESVEFCAPLSSQRLPLTKNEKESAERPFP
jgi:hypothetical protein